MWRPSTASGAREERPSTDLLTGGLNEVRRTGERVVRPAGAHSPTVHASLRHLRRHGFEAGPDALALDTEAGTEMLSWVPGDVVEYPLTRHRTARDERLMGVLDFDTAHPGPRLADVGYAAYRWVPLDAPVAGEDGVIAEQRRRMSLFCEAYAVDGSTASVLEAAIRRLRDLISFMTEQAEAGHTDFRRHLDDGHAAVYRAAIEHMEGLR